VCFWGEREEGRKGGGEILIYEEKVHMICTDFNKAKAGHNITPQNSSNSQLVAINIAARVCLDILYSL